MRKNQFLGKIKFPFRALIILVLLGLGCGQASSPPAGIPAPISQLMSVSNPDGSGNVLVTGAPGSALSGASVLGSNASQNTGNLLLGLLIRVARAGVNPVTASPEGNFQLSLNASVGDSIQIVQTVDGVSSPPANLTVMGNSIALGTRPQALAPVSNGGLAVTATGDTGSPGEYYSLPLGEENPVMSFPPPNFVFETCQQIGATLVDLADDRSEVICRGNDEMFDFSFSQEDTPPIVQQIANPLTMKGLPEFNTGIIGQEDPSNSIQLFESSSGKFTCRFLITHPDLLTPHVQTPLVDLIPISLVNNEIIILTVSEFEDGAWVLTRLQFNACPDFEVLNQIILPEGILPAGLVGVGNGTQALISDAATNQVYRVDFGVESLTPIPVGPTPRGLAISNPLNRAYVVNQGNNSITAIDLGDLSTQTKAGVGLEPTQIVITTLPDQAAVLSTLDNSIVTLELDF